MKYKLLRTSAVFAVGALLAVEASASLINLGPGSFTPLANQITFDEWAYGTVNPSITEAAGSLGNVTVSFAGNFVGQTVVGGGVKTITGTPLGPLTLDTALANQTYIVNDGASGSNPVLSGTPQFNGPVSVHFSTPVAAVGLKGGYFNTIGATTIEAYDANGLVLGGIVNSVLGFEFYGLADSSGENVISGISFYITGNEPAGFAIDNVTFGAKEVVQDLPDTGSTVVLLLGSLLGLAVIQKRFSVAAVR